MRKYGKFEKRPEVMVAKKHEKKSTEKQPGMKSVLLQTYFTSLLSLVLCVSMFLGTSYAWFSSEVNNTANEIYIGILDADLRLVKNDTVQSLKGADAPKIFTDNVKWEPGYTAVETLQVVNQGDLTFNYELKFISEDEVLNSGLASLFEVYVCNTTNRTVELTNFEAIQKDEANWTRIGNLEEILTDSISLFEGEMITVGKVKPTETSQPAEAAQAEEIGKTTPKWNEDGTDTYIIALHMKDDVQSEVNGKSIMGEKLKLNVKLIAYQRGSETEKDGFGNQNYDNNVTVVRDAKSLESALRNGGNTQLITNVKIGNVEDRVTMDGGVLYGNGKEIAYNGGRVNDGSVGVVTTSGGTIKDLTINGGEDGRALYVTTLASDLNVSDCTFSGAYAFNLNSATVTDHTINFTNTTFKSWTSYANVMSSANFTGCTFEAVLKPYGDTVLTDCVFSGGKLDVSALENGETITLINCTYNNVLVEKAVLTANNEGITIAESDLIVVNTDKEVVLKTNG